MWHQVPRRQLIIWLALSVAVLVVGLAAFGAWRSVGLDKVTEYSVDSSYFSFDGALAPGWYVTGTIENPFEEAGPSGAPDSEVSAIATQGTKETFTGKCLAMLNYFPNKNESPEGVLDRIKKQPDAAILEPVRTRSLTMRTSDGRTQYDLGQYRLAGPSTSETLTHIELAAFRVGTGHVTIRGYCPESVDLDVTLPLLEAFSLHP